MNKKSIIEGVVIMILGTLFIYVWASSFNHDKRITSLEDRFNLIFELQNRVSILQNEVSNVRSAEPWTSNSRIFNPPSVKGDIYVIINRNSEQIVSLTVDWGEYKPPRTEIDLSNYDGLVLHLRHMKDDSYPLKVITNGNIVTGPYQGNKPEEWNNNRYKTLAW